MEKELILQVGVKIFLKNNEGKFLLVQRNLDKYSHMELGASWGSVGGRIDVGESLFENLKREVFEETQMRLDSDPRLIHAQDILFDDKHVVRLTYIGEGAGEVVLDTEENVDFAWVSLEELKTFENLDPYVKEIIKKNLLK